MALVEAPSTCPGWSAPRAGVAAPGPAAPGASYRLPIAGQPGAHADRDAPATSGEQARRRRPTQYHAGQRRGRRRFTPTSASSSRNWSRHLASTPPRPRPPARRADASAPSDGDDPADPAAGHQHDPPAGQHDQGERDRPAARARRAVERLRTPRWPRVARGPRRPGFAPATAASAGPRPARPARPGRRYGVAASAIGTAEPSSRSASKQVRSPVWQAAPSWSTLTSRVSPSQSRRTSLDLLPVAGGLALDPVLLARAAPERRRAGGQGAVQRLVVHPAQHQHLAGVVLLHDRRDQAVGVALEARGDGRVEGHGPLSARSSAHACWATQRACSPA